MGMAYSYYIKILYSPLLKLIFCNEFNRQKEKKWQDQILKVSSLLCTSLTLPEAENLSFITSNKWENLKNDMLYRKQIVYTSFGQMY